MKRILIILILTTVSISVGCDFTKEEPPELLECIVYVDFSTSQDTLSLEEIMDGVNQIYKQLPAERPVSFQLRAIHKDAYGGRIFSVEKDAVDVKSKYDRELRRIEQTSEADTLRKYMKSYFLDAQKKENELEETCICNTIMDTDGLLTRQEDTEVWVFVLSDLLEECSGQASYMNEDFFMCNSRKQNYSTKELLKIVENFEPKKKLNEIVKPDHLVFLMSGSQYYNGTKNGKNKCMNTVDTVDFWYKILQKLGYQESELAKIRFTQVLPMNNLFRKAP